MPLDIPDDLARAKIPHPHVFIHTARYHVLVDNLRSQIMVRQQLLESRWEAEKIEGRS
jgi:hypothetical protein